MSVFGGRSSPLDVLAEQGDEGLCEGVREYEFRSNDEDLERAKC
jgi:hypothetical protein